MDNRQQQENFSYWKRPGQRWLCLAAGILQLLALGLNIIDYSRISAVAGKIFTDSGWTEYTADTIQTCAIKGIAALCFLGVFLIGRLARSKRASQRAEGILFLFLALGTGIALWGCSLYPAGGKVIFWACMTLACLGGAAYCFWRGRK